jgi:hypothetical protein
VPGGLGAEVRGRSGFSGTWSESRAAVLSALVTSLLPCARGMHSRQTADKQQLTARATGKTFSALRAACVSGYVWRCGVDSTDPTWYSASVIMRFRRTTAGPGEWRDVCTVSVRVVPRLAPQLFMRLARPSFIWPAAQIGNSYQRGKFPELLSHVLSILAVCTQSHRNTSSCTDS